MLELSILGFLAEGPLRGPAPGAAPHGRGARGPAVLRRRLDFLEAPTSFFYEGGEPVAAEGTGDLFRQGMPRVARATGAAERAWLGEALEVLSQPS